MSPAEALLAALIPLYAFGIAAILLPHYARYLNARTPHHRGHAARMMLLSLVWPLLAIRGTVRLITAAYLYTRRTR